MIKVIDSESGRGIPLVELKTMHNVSYFTDSNGLIAFMEPGLMGQKVFFHINGQGYEYPQDIFGYRGIVLIPVAGDSSVIKLDRTNIAERLYRTTGAGIYNDSYLLGKSMPIKNPLINSKVLGQDSNLGVVYKNKIFWVWGDTYKMSYPLGNFSVSGATSELPENSGLPVNKGIDYTYFENDEGFSKKMIDIPGQGFVWFDWLLVLKDQSGKEKLVAKYARVKPNFENYERGIAVFNDQLQQFEKYKQIDEWLPDYNVINHPFLAQSAQGIFYYFTSEFSFSRIKPDLDAISNASQYESYTCLKEGQQFDKDNPLVERAKDGSLVWNWKKRSTPVGVNEQQILIEKNVISAEEGWFFLRDFYSGKNITTDRNSISWNSSRKKWILIAGVKVGEIWYAEADTPLGPWIFAKRIVKHDKFFYNPAHHIFFDEDNGRKIYFEATYTNAFLPEKNLTPRYEYNQLMYSLTLDRAELFMPEPVYKIKTHNNRYMFGRAINHQKDRIEEVSFLAFAPGRTYSNLIPVYSDGLSLSTKPGGKNEILFYALPAKENEGIDGHWDITITDNLFFSKNFRITINSSLEKINVEIEHPGMTLQSSQWKEKQFSLSYSYFGEVFNLQGFYQDGKLQGSWAKSDSSRSGSWEAPSIGAEWQTLYSASVAPLYEYINKNTADKYYSTSVRATDTSFIRTIEPVCRVWKTPSQKMHYDFSIKWIGQRP